MTVRIGVDLGGTKIEVVALRGNDIVVRKRLPTPQGNYEATVASIVRLVFEVENELGVMASVGVGVPGVEIPSTGIMRNSNAICLIGKPLRSDIEKALGRSIRMANDANCMALSEAVDGAGAGADVVFGVILGSGVGGGVVANNKVLVGAHGITGEWGHTLLPKPGEVDLPLPQCYCGRQGCVENYCCGPAVQREYERLSGKKLDMRQLETLAVQGDVHAEEVLVRLEDRLARSLAQVIQILDPNVIVLAGGVSNIERLYRNLPGKISHWITADDLKTRILKNRHGDSTGVRGAAWLWD